jgi:hypothetical protein
MVFLSIALFTAFIGRCVKTAASVGVNKESSVARTAHLDHSLVGEHIGSVVVI